MPYTSSRRRTGLIPSLGTQLVLTSVMASIAHRRAAAQAALGVDPRIATVNGFAAANYVVGYVVFIAPVAFISMFAGLRSPLAVLVFEPLALLGVVIGVRLSTWWQTRADVQNLYRIPTGLLVALGPLWMVVCSAMWLLCAVVASSTPR